MERVSLGEIVDKFSDKDLDDWCNSVRESRKDLYDGLLSRNPGDPCEWGFMDNPAHPLYHEFRHFATSGSEKPSSTLMSPDGSNWNWIMSFPHSVGSDDVVTVDRKSCRTLKHSNVEWNKTLRDLSRVGKPDGSPDSDFSRPCGKYILDLVNMELTSECGYKLLNVSHYLAHKYGMSMAEGLSTIHLCMQYGIPFMVNGRPGPEAFGIKVSTSTDFRKPDGVVPVFDGLQYLKTELVLFSGVFVEPHPKNFEDPSVFLEVNRWSCSPTLSVLSGFEYPDFVCKSPIVTKYGTVMNAAFMIPVMAMLPMCDFEKALAVRVRSMARSKVFDTDWNETMIEDWMDRCDVELSSIPPLPCMDCLRFNTQAEGHPMRPRCRRPDNMKDGSAEAKEWTDYDEKVKKIFQIIDRAACYCEGRSNGHSRTRRERRARKAEFNRKKKVAEKIASLEKRVAKAYEKGNVDKAVELSSRLKSLVNS